MKLGIGVLFVFVSMTSLVRAQQPINEWKGVIPLHSTRADVEKIFGIPKKTYKDAFYESAYETELETIRVEYSEGRCHENRYSVWKVPKDTVIRVSVSPKGDMSIPQFKKLFPQNFTRLVDPNLPSHVHYRNDDGSVGFTTKILRNGSEDVLSFSVHPA